MLTAKQYYMIQKPRSPPLLVKKDGHGGYCTDKVPIGEIMGVDGKNMLGSSGSLPALFLS